MKLAKVVKKVVSTIKHHSFEKRPLMLVQPVTPQLKATGKEVLAVDFVHASIGEIVLLMEEGSSCQQMLNDKKAPVDSAIVAIVDRIDLESRSVYEIYPDANKRSGEGD